jgi:hypothetical protein
MSSGFPHHKQGLVTIEQFIISDQLHVDFDMPMVVRSPMNDISYVTVPPLVSDSTKALANLLTLHRLGIGNSIYCKCTT